MLPNFIIIGAPKAGTTSLYHYLSEHPQVFMSEPKEVNYFSREERTKKPVLDNKIKTYLLSIYKPDIQNLEKLLNKNLSYWYNK